MDREMGGVAAHPDFPRRFVLQPPPQPPPQPAPAAGPPRADDLRAGIAASLAALRPEELEQHEPSDDEEEGQIFERERARDPRPHTLEGLVCATEDSPRFDGPLPGMRVHLFAHQLANLRELVRREVDGCVTFDAGGARGRLVSNVGVFADLPGMGKTATAVALITLQHEPRRTRTAGVSLGRAGVYVEESDGEPGRVPASLVVCPQRLVKHWLTEIEQKSTLRCLAYRAGHMLTAQDLEEVDVVVATTRSYVRCCKVRWRRVVVDEADVARMPGRVVPLSYDFLWLVTGSYTNLAHRGSTGWIHNALLHELHHPRGAGPPRFELYNRLIVKSDDDFVRRSCGTPDYAEDVVLCRTPGVVRASREFISREVAEMLAAGDAERAVVELGGRAGSADDVMTLLRQNTERDLKNERETIRHVRALDIDEHSRHERLARAEEKMRELEARLARIEASVKELEGTSSECLICYNEPEAPTLLLCCGSVYCGRCLIAWFSRWLRDTCVKCRRRVDLTTQMVALTKEQIVAQRKDRELTKLDALRTICESRSRVLVFANHHGAIDAIARRLGESVSCEVFGGQNTTALARFRAGKLPVLVMDPKNTSGVAISEARVVVLYHEMEPGLEKQAIGRAQRLDRTGPLEVFRLRYQCERQA